MKYYMSYKEAKDMEEPFKNKGDLESKKGYKIIKGNNSKIMISCPHSVSQLRKGKIKIRENYVGVISKIVQKNTGCHLIIKTRNMDDDANFDKNSNYKDELESYIKKNNIKLLIDLHGCFSHKFDIEIGTYYGNNITDKNIIKTIYNNFLDNDISSIILDKIKCSGINTISYDMKSRTGINTIQLEIGRKYRWPKTRIDSFNKIIETLINIVNELEGKKIIKKYNKKYSNIFDKILDIDLIKYQYEKNLVGMKINLGTNYNLKDEKFIENTLLKLKKIVYDNGCFLRRSKVISDYSFSIILKPMEVNNLIKIYTKILKVIKNSRETIIYKNDYNSSLTLRFSKIDIEKYHKNLINYLYKNKNLFRKDKYTKILKKSSYKKYLNKQEEFTGKYALVNYLNKRYLEVRNLKLKIKTENLKEIIINILDILGGKNE